MAPDPSGLVVWEEVTPAKLTSLGKEDRKNRKCAPKQPALKIKPPGDVWESCPWPDGAATGDIRWALLISQHWTCPCQPRVSVPPRSPGPTPSPRTLQHLPARVSCSSHREDSAATPCTVVMQSLVVRHGRAPAAPCRCREGRAFNLNYRRN